MADAVVTVRGRKVERVHHVSWERVPVLADGLRDPEERHRVLELAMVASGIGGYPEDLELAAIRAGARQALLAYHWEPSQAQWAEVSGGLTSSALGPSDVPTSRSGKRAPANPEHPADGIVVSVFGVGRSDHEVLLPIPIGVEPADEHTACVAVGGIAHKFEGCVRR